jgi:sialate O-acetylesterase
MVLSSLLFATTATAAAPPAAVRFSNVLGSSMVLQQAPDASQLWGTYAGPVRAGQTLQLVLERVPTASSLPAGDGGVAEAVSVPIGADGRWSAQLSPVPAGPQAYRATATTSGAKPAVLDDLVFGDVFVCGGQSNMQFSVGNASNATAEIAAASALGASIRLMTAGRVVAEDRQPAGKQHMQPQQELPYVEQAWSRASAQTVGGPWGSNFSAVCWFFGREVQRKRGYPIGLVSANWGSSRIETWMSPQGLAQCSHLPGFHGPSHPQPPSKPGCKHLGQPCTVHPMVHNNNSGECCGGRCFYYSKPPLWPAGGYCDEKSPSNENVELFDNVITPLLNMTIKGAIWYQGESDTGNENPTDGDLASRNYACMMPALVSDWRAHWSRSSGTAADFPFGIVQLSATGAPTGLGPALAPEGLRYAAVRWGQTANYGYAPNPKQPRTFMAVAVDLGAYQGGCCAGRSDCNTYPSLCIHPWWKQEVGRRLALGAQVVAYHDQSACHSGPFPSAATTTMQQQQRSVHTDSHVKVTFVQAPGCGSEGISLRRTQDFELRLAPSGNWSLATVVASDSHSVTLTPAGGLAGKAMAVRYLWSTSPGSHPRFDETPGNVSVYGKGAQAESLPTPPFFLPVTVADGLI